MHVGTGVQGLDMARAGGRIIDLLLSDIHLSSFIELEVADSFALIKQVLSRG